MSTESKYASRFTYVDSLPADAEKIENIRGIQLHEFYYSSSLDQFYSIFKDDGGEVKRIRICEPNKKGLVFARDENGKGVCITVSKFKRERSSSNNNEEKVEEKVDGNITISEDELTETEPVKPKKTPKRSTNKDILTEIRNNTNQTLQIVSRILEILSNN